MLTALGQISAMGAMWNKQNVHLDLQMDFGTVSNSSAFPKTSPRIVSLMVSGAATICVPPISFHAQGCLAITRATIASIALRGGGWRRTMSTSGPEVTLTSPLALKTEREDKSRLL